MSDKKEELEKNEKQENTNTERNELQTKQQELDELTDRYKRILAEFENHKKRSQKEREGLYNSILGDVVEVMKTSGENVLTKVLSITDEDGNEMESCPHPQQVFYVKLSETPDEFDILRRQENEAIALD